MARYLELEEVKSHLVVDSTVDDAYIGRLMEVAEGTVEAELDRPLIGLEDAQGNLPAPVRHAMLLVVGTLYANREAVAVGVSAVKLPYTLDWLQGLYKNYPLS